MELNVSVGRCKFEGFVLIVAGLILQFGVLLRMLSFLGSSFEGDASRFHVFKSNPQMCYNDVSGPIQSAGSETAKLNTGSSVSILHTCGWPSLSRQPICSTCDDSCLHR